MLKTGLEFAPGTTDDCKRAVARMFTPADIFDAYKMGRHKFSTGDLVLIASEQDMDGFDVRPRVDYVSVLRRNLGQHAARTMPTLTIASKSAHAVMNLPFEADAMWLIIVRGQQVPIMCVIYATPYKMSEASPS